MGVDDHRVATLMMKGVMDKQISYRTINGVHEMHLHNEI
jgi:hypothetical protein